MGPWLCFASGAALQVGVLALIRWAKSGGETQPVPTAQDKPGRSLARQVVKGGLLIGRGVGKGVKSVGDGLKVVGTGALVSGYKVRGSLERLASEATAELQAIREEIARESAPPAPVLLLAPLPEPAEPKLVAAVAAVTAVTASPPATKKKAARGTPKRVPNQVA